MGSITTWGFLSWTSWKCIPPGGWQEHSKTGQSHTTSTATNPGEKTFIAHFLLLFKKKMFFFFFQLGWRCNIPKNSAFSSHGCVGCLQTTLCSHPFAFSPLKISISINLLFFGGEGSKQREKWLVALERSSFPSHCQQLHPSLPWAGTQTLQVWLRRAFISLWWEWEKNCANRPFFHVEVRYWMFPCGMAEFSGVSMMEAAGLGCSPPWGL